MCYQEGFEGVYPMGYREQNPILPTMPLVIVQAAFFIYIAISQYSPRREVMHIFFSNREHRAFERMMQEKPGHDHYDSGVDGRYPECRRCLYHQPYRRDRFCRYTLCPFAPEHSTVRTEEEVKARKSTTGIKTGLEVSS